MTHDMREADTIQAADRLRQWIRDRLQGGCRLLSQGSACQCALCDLDRLCDALRADAQKAPQPRTAPEQRTMPMYGEIPWQKLIDAVSEATIGKPGCWEPDESYYVGHAPVSINMNSLNRIVSKFAAPQPRTAEPVAVSLEEIERLARTMWRGEPLPGRVLRFGAAVLGLCDAAKAEPAPAPADEPPPLPPPALEDHPYERWGQNMSGDFYTADQMRARDAYWIAKLQAERSKP
jgi:hypothetical protein